MLDPSFVLSAFVAFAIFGVFWTTQFVQLMLLEDGMFPGRSDKALWVAAFVVAFPFTPFAFRMWRSARLAERAAAGRAT
ncbi:MAG TPA: hypothetical protein VF796_13515 [Humisphaera sp.]